MPHLIALLLALMTGQRDGAHLTVRVCAAQTGVVSTDAVLDRVAGHWQVQRTGPGRVARTLRLVGDGAAPMSFVTSRWAIVLPLVAAGVAGGLMDRDKDGAGIEPGAHVLLVAGSCVTWELRVRKTGPARAVEAVPLLRVLPQ